jgi:hypothetical protein
LKKNKFSKRSLKFIERNSPKNKKTRDYIDTLAQKAFQLNNYLFIENKKNVFFKIENYILVLNEEYVELQLYKNNIKIQTFLGDSCWYQGLKFIKEDLKK